jgi:hypothetical protein
LEVSPPLWSAAQKVISEFAPPWTDAVVLSPGGQTPATKRILKRAIELATSSGQPVDVEHIWSALRQCEPELVATVLARLADAAGQEQTDGEGS